MLYKSKFVIMKRLVMIAVLCCTTVSFAQLLTSGPLRPTQVVDSNRLNDLTALRFSKQDQLENVVKGSIYLFKDWDNSSVIEVDNKKYLLKSVNYNILADQFQFKVSEDSVFVFDNTIISEVKLNNKRFKQFYFGLDEGDKYCEVLFEGEKSSLLKKYDVKFDRAQPNPLMLKDISDKYVKTTKYFLIDNNTKTISSIKMKKKSLAVLFDDKFADVDSYVKKNKLSLKKEGDLMKVFKYYNSL